MSRTTPCRVEPMVAHPGSDREGLAAFPPLQTEQARFRALRFPVGPVDSGRADSSLPTERCTSLRGLSSAFLSTSVGFPFDRLTLTDLHHVLAITARRWATTLPPSSIPYAGIFASPHMGCTVLEFPSSVRRDVLATRSCLLYAERIRDSPGGRGDPAWPPLSHFGPGVSAIFTCRL